MPDIIGAYTSPLGRHDDRLCTFFEDKYVPGGEGPAYVLKLGQMLSAKWETDAHFAQYHGQTDDGTRATKGGNNGPLAFDVACFDMDFEGHATPPAGSFEKLVRRLWVCDHTPNIVYETMHGARLIYCIERIHDADEFEHHFQSFLKKLNGHVNGHGYQLDAAAKDWTRLFRCPLVTREVNGWPIAQHNFLIREFHDNVIDLRRHRAIKKPKPVFSGDRDFDGKDPYIWHRLAQIAHGNRNSNTFAAAAWAVSKYKPADAERWLDVIANKASEAGLDDREISSIINSARKAKK